MGTTEMSKVHYFKKKSVQPMEAWDAEYDMTGVSVSIADEQAGSPKLGDFIASNPNNPSDKWLVAAKFIEENYEEVQGMGDNTFFGRLVNEEQELGTKLVGLSNGLNSDGFAKKVGDYQFELLSLQQSVMAAYRRILRMRIQDLTPSEKSSG